jgi:hypothetical protein
MGIRGDRGSLNVLSDSTLFGRLGTTGRDDLSKTISVAPRRLEKNICSLSTAGNRNIEGEWDRFQQSVPVRRR